MTATASPIALVKREIHQEYQCFLAWVAPAATRPAQALPVVTGGVYKGHMATAPRPRICPDCREKRVVPIAYGFPGPEMGEAEQRGEVALGGCLVGPENPSWLCRSCGHEFLSLRPLRRPVPFDPEWLPEPSPTRLP